MWRFRIDYTKAPLGKRTRDGDVSACPHCGQRGAYLHWTHDGREFERWLHLKQGVHIVRTEAHSCGMQVAGPPPSPRPLPAGR